jgi:hypothetical protein
LRQIKARVLSAQMKASRQYSTDARVDLEFTPASGEGSDWFIGKRLCIRGPAVLRVDGTDNPFFTIPVKLRKLGERAIVVPVCNRQFGVAHHLTKHECLKIDGSSSSGANTNEPSSSYGIGCNPSTEVDSGSMDTRLSTRKNVQPRISSFQVIDTSYEKLGDGVRRITGGYGADIVIDGVGGEVLSEALGALASGGSLTNPGVCGGPQGNH